MPSLGDHRLTCFLCYVLDGGDADGNLWSWEDIKSSQGLRMAIQSGEQFGASIAFINDHFISLLIGAPGEPLGSQGGSVYVLTATPL